MEDSNDSLKKVNKDLKDVQEENSLLNKKMNKMVLEFQDQTNAWETKIKRM